MRLIDADALIEAMKKTESEYENAMTCPSWWSAFNVISEQPTAYDIDKVVEELEKNASRYTKKYVTPYGNNGYKDTKAISIHKAIEIVKQGGVSNRKVGAIDKLKNALEKYEDLEEQGLLLRLPCKVGDKAWYVNRDGINEVIVDSFVFNVNLLANVSVYIGAERFGKTLTPYKTLFFSKEEAEQKLKEMESD